MLATEKLLQEEMDSHSIDGVQIIIRNSEGALLFGKRLAGKVGGGTWSFVGGRVNKDINEEPVSAAQRETLEEIGKSLPVGNFIFIGYLMTHLIAGSDHMQAVYMLDDLIDLPLDLESRSFEDAGFFPMNSLPENIFNPTREILKALEVIHE